MLLVNIISETKHRLTLTVVHDSQATTSTSFNRRENFCEYLVTSKLRWHRNFNGSSPHATSMQFTCVGNRGANLKCTRNYMKRQGRQIVGMRNGLVSSNLHRKATRCPSQPELYRVRLPIQNDQALPLQSTVPCSQR